MFAIKGDYKYSIITQVLITLNNELQAQFRFFENDFFAHQ